MLNQIQPSLFQETEFPSPELYQLQSVAFVCSEGHGPSSVDVTNQSVAFVCSEGHGPSSVDVTKDLSEMSLATPPLPSTFDTATASRGELIAQAHKNLPSISSMFVGSFQGMRRALDVSR